MAKCLGIMKISRAVKFLKNDIWRIRKGELTRLQYFFIRQLKIIILSLRGMYEDNCRLRASALTLYTLLSIVPLAAMFFGIAKGFGFETSLETLLYEKFQGQEAVLSKVIGFAHSLIQNTKGGLIAGVGFIVLFWAVITVISHIENAFNGIWGVKKARSFGRKISDYLSLILICPFLFLLSSAISVFVFSELRLLAGKIGISDIIGPAIFLALKLLPFFVLWLLFAFIYIYLPNTRVNIFSGILAGIFAGTIYQIFQWGYIYFQVGIARYNTIYGSFAALPLFLIWLQLSWLILLFGAEISFAHQNVDTYDFEPDCLRISNSLKRLLALRIIHLLVIDFNDEKDINSESVISQKLGIPIRLVRRILSELLDSGLISGIMTNHERKVAYQPAHNTNTMTIKYVIDALDRNGSNNIPYTRSDELKIISKSLRAFSELLENSPANILLKDICACSEPAAEISIPA